MEKLTQLLAEAASGDGHAAEQVLPLVYAELRALARMKMANEKPGQTLQPTALVHEAWLRLGDQRFENRAHFFGAAAEAMRRILVERARRRLAARNGGGLERCDLDDLEIAAPIENEERLIAVHEALDRFSREEPDKAELVKLRFFTGVSLAEACAIMGLSERTAKRHWAFARAWLMEAIDTRR